MVPAKPDPANETKWRVVAVDPDQLYRIDRRICSGGGRVLVEQFENRTRDRQQPILDRFLKSCRGDDKKTYLKDCNGLRFRFWVNELESSIMILNTEYPAAGERQ